ncbi:thiamine phosphate synthase [Nocardioides sp.]|uniref:thiamine phosphate synthase n=1 Tax=Nocardioides sp. TaxID=35761 RepID=UPI002CDD955E|nr:thiamine phosphate synthase [Nocardioides sp.]HSX68886.1 thiamine phosphate synthase [Nocardioides sp.]
MRLVVPRLMCLVSSTDDLARLPALAMAGVDGFQVRDKTLGRDGLIALTNHVMNLVPAAKVIVNDRVDVAVITGADGVHVGATDMPVAEVVAMVGRAQARGFLPDRFLVGATCRAAADVRAAAEAGAAYAGVGPVFATGSKEGLPDPLGVEGLGAAVVPEGVPVLAIGGLDASNAAEVVAAGAHGVAVIGGIWRAPDPVAAACALAAVVR